ncbi:hypothetical protein [Algivirga pacifica]|uniref:Uncharacterized protein n=1 Tax=Algivirga pacifica TaxID=1162670 RepID=A0ABP9D5E7_9BACT
MKFFLSTLFFQFILLYSVTAQIPDELILVHSTTKDTISIQKGTDVHFMYRGYLGQTDFIEGKVSAITTQDIWIQSKKNNQESIRQVQITDLTAVRKYSPARKWVLPALHLGAAAGNWVFTTHIEKQYQLNTTQAILTGVGLSLATNLLIKWCFPTKPNRRISKTRWVPLIKRAEYQQIL